MLVATFLLWSALQFIDNISAAPRSFSTSQTLEFKGATITIAGCAASCIRAQIQQSFPVSVCSDPQDLSCLCTSPGQTGYTIGEEILQCMISNCPDATSDQLSQGYSICSSIPNAVLPTHATITAQIPEETTVFVEPTRPTSSLSITRAIPSSSSSTTSIATSASISAAQKASASATSALASSTPTAVPTVNPVLTNPQIIGVTVSLGLLALIAMALLTYICCFRRRDRPESTQSFSTTQPLIPRMETFGLVLPTNTSQTNPYVPSKAQSLLGQKYPVWSPMTQSHSAYTSYQGLVATPKPDERSITPGSAVTYQTTSKLLPEKPIYQAPVRPTRDGTEGELLTVPSTGRTRGSPTTFQASPDSFNSGPILNRQPSDPFLQAPEPLYSPTRGAGNERNARMNLPKLNTKTVQFASNTTPAELPQPPLVPYNPTSYAYFAETQIPDWRTAQTRNANISRTGLALTMNDSPSTIPRQSTVSSFRPLPPPKAEATFNKYRPIPPSKSRPAASTVTSFESDDNDDNGLGPRLPSLPVWRKPVPAVTSQHNEQARRQFIGSPQHNPRSTMGSSDIPIMISTSLSKVQYPVVPASSTTATPVSSRPVHPFIAKQRQQEQEQQSRGSPHEVSPLTPQVQRKEPFVLPRWDQDLLDQIVLSTTASTSTPLQHYQNVDPISLQRGIKNYSQNEIPFSNNPVDVSRLLDQGFVELPERSSGQHWDSTKSTHKANVALPRHLLAKATINTSPPPPMMLVELPSPDAERLVSPTARATAAAAAAAAAVAATTTPSPKSQSRGARLGAAMANKTPQARPRGASDGNVQADPVSTQRPRPAHSRTQSHTPSTKPLTYNLPRPLEEIGLEPAARRHLQSGRYSPPRGQS